MKRPSPTPEQARTILTCLALYDERGMAAVWHFNNCGCCCVVHADVPHPVGGFVVGRDGGADWLAGTPE